MKTLDLNAVQAFALVASLASFTRAAEATGTTQSAVSLKLKRLEEFLGRKLLERTPRSVHLTADGKLFLEHANDLLAANQRALLTQPAAARHLKLGIGDHAAGPELPMLLARLRAADRSLALEVDIGISQELVRAFDDGKFDAVIVRQERSRRGGETVADDGYAWVAAPSFEWHEDEPIPLASLAPPCGVRAVGIRALDAARLPWREVIVGGGVAAVAAAVSAGLAVAVLARRLAPIGSIEIGAKFGLPRLPRSKVVLYSRVRDPRTNAALRTVAAVFRGAIG